MDVRETRNQADDRVVCPVRCVRVEGVQSDEQRERPELQDNCSGYSAVDDFAEVAGHE